MENPIIGIAAKFQYKISSIRILAVVDTFSWSRGRLHRKELYFPTKILKSEERSWCDYFPPPSLEQLALKTIQWNVIIIIIIIIIIIVVVDDDTHYWVCLSSYHPFQLYYKVW